MGKFLEAKNDRFWKRFAVLEPNTPRKVEVWLLVTLRLPKNNALQFVMVGMSSQWYVRFSYVFIFLYVRTNVPPQLDRQVETIVSKRVFLLAMVLRFNTVAIKTVGLSVVCSKSRIDHKFITKKIADIVLQFFFATWH